VPKQAIQLEATTLMLKLQCVLQCVVLLACWNYSNTTYDPI